MSLQLRRVGIWGLYEVPLSVSLLGFGIGTMLANFHVCLVKQFKICLGVFVILLLNVMELLCVGGGALLDKPCMVFHRMCVLCLWSQ